ncbi:MAG: 50S ribosomal protein L15 [Dehalococcoidia bacterium]
MRQNEVKLDVAAKHKRKRVGRGVGSGNGTYSCRGIKGQNARSGGGVHPLFDGKADSLIKCLPKKRGFNNPFRVDYNAVNLDRLNAFPAGSEITPEKLISAGIVKRKNKPVKVLGEGDIDRQLVVKAHSFSQAAREKIETAGGTAEVIR